MILGLALPWKPTPSSGIRLVVVVLPWTVIMIYSHSLKWSIIIGVQSSLLKIKGSNRNES